MFNAVETLKNGAKQIDIDITDKNVDDFISYYNLLIEWNKNINLTAITEPKEVAIKHFIDSLCFLKYVDIKKGQSLLDVGTGAGFPSVPIGIIRKDIDITMMDCLNKRLNFLKEVTNTLNINANIVHNRAEIAGKDITFREKYDFVTARAVANLSALSEYCLPFVKVGGFFVAMKGPSSSVEIDNSLNIISLLGGEIQDNFNFTLPDKSERSIILIKKISNTSKIYPRSYKKISSNKI